MNQTTLSFLVLLYCVGCSLTAGRRMGCETSGVVSEGSPAKLTCVFKDSFNKEDFMVYRNKSARGKELILALCGWEKGKLHCRHFDGFRLKAEESNGRVIFETESAKLNQSGTYFCKTLPAANSEATGCNLTVQKNSIIGNGIIGCHTTPPSTDEQASIFCTFPKSIGMNGIILEKFNDNNGRRKDEIARCEKSGGCTLKEGYEYDYKTPTELKVSIAHVSSEQAGFYICRSPSLPDATAICTLSLSTGESNGGTSRSINELVIPMYAILACFIVLMMAGAVALGYTVFQRRRRQSSPSTRNKCGISPIENGNVQKTRDPLLKEHTPAA